MQKLQSNGNRVYKYLDIDSANDRHLTDAWHIRWSNTNYYKIQISLRQFVKKIH